MMPAGGSAALHQRARRLVPAGVHSNARARAPHPLYFARAGGAHLWDVDGNRWLDCQMGNGAVMLGHAHPEVDGAVRAALAAGLPCGQETAAAVEAVERLAALVPGFGQARFANTGTEALLHALAVARHASGRQRVAKAEGAYHGWLDPLWVSTWPRPDQLGPAQRPANPPGSAGLSSDAARTVVLPFNDPDASERILREHAAELAAVVVEPVLIDTGYVPATAEYLKRLRAATTELGIVLVFDELLTGFRLAPGGAREHYGVSADLTTYGKALANGYPVAVLEGRVELLAATDPTAGGPVGYVGTFNGHPLVVAAAAASLGALAGGGAHAYLERLTDRLRDGFEALAGRHGIDAVLAGGGGHFQPYFTSGPVASYRDALRSEPGRYATWRDTLAARGILVAPGPLGHCALSTAHRPEDVDQLLDATGEAFARMAASA